MNFVNFCVGVVISIICFFGSILIAAITTSASENDDALGYFSSLVISDIVIGILITVLLVQNNII